MAYVDSVYRGEFPKLTEYVATELPDVTHRPRVFNAFIKYAEYGKICGIWVLPPYMGPAIQVWPLNLNSKNGDYIYAEYQQKSPGNIYVDSAQAQRFERDYIRVPQASALMEACLLHEMCHQGDWADGVPQADEPGMAFEKEAYGAVQDGYWVGPV